jgi:hypothetical protein
MTDVADQPTTVDAASIAWSAPPPPSGPPVDIDAYALAASLQSLVALGAATSARSTQTTLGSSEAGHQCDRRIAYRLAGVPAVNHGQDPLRAFVGTGLHLGMGELFHRLDGGSGRFLIESKVDYRGTPGTVDLYDRFTRTVIDWKSTTKSKVQAIRHDGPAMPYVVQVHLYGAALAAAGEAVQSVALAFIPVDGLLSGLYVWRAPFEQRIADEAVDRINRLRRTLPAEAHHRPDRLCPWCHHYMNGSTDLTVGCPGE